MLKGNALVKQFVISETKLKKYDQESLVLSPINCKCCPDTETGQLICHANQLIGFYMRVTLVISGLILDACEIELVYQRRC